MSCTVEITIDTNVTKRQKKVTLLLLSTSLECQPRLCSDCSHGGKGQEEESFLHAHHAFGQEARV